MSLPGITRRQLAVLLAGSGIVHKIRGADLALSLNHIKLRVANLDRSVAFYYRLFGGPMAEAQGGSYLTPPGMRAVFMKIGSGKTYLILSPPDPTVPVGLEHVSLDRAGLFIADKFWIPHAFSLDPSYFRDPDGNLLEFVTDRFWNSSLPDRAPSLPADIAARPPVFEPLAIRRVALKTPDLRRSAGFYALFGAEVGAAQPNRRRSFDFQGTTLELVPGRPRPSLESFTVAVRSFDADAVRRRLHALGIHTPGHQPMALHDPDGNRVEVVPAH